MKTRDDEKAERLNQVYRYAFANYGITSQTKFAEALGVQRTALSAAMNGNAAYLTKNLFIKVCATFPDTFNLDWLLTGKGEMLLNKEEPEHESTIVELYAKLIKEHEAMRQQTKDALDEINKLKKQYEDSVIMLKDVTTQLQSLMKHVPRIYPTLEEQNPSLAADTNASCLDIRQKVKEK